MHGPRGSEQSHPKRARPVGESTRGVDLSSLGLDLWGLSFGFKGVFEGFCAHLQGLSEGSSNIRKHEAWVADGTLKAHASVMVASGTPG